ncbi:MAG TPA: bifunctional phosphopantothenoylcysteine decarboxylase/phosphopantothenate--cysteine ligase CoaBC, partial [Myxococcales bacterium]
MAVQGRRVLLCVGGGIAAYKSCEVARLLVKAGAQVRVALTPAAQRFVTALTFQALTGAAVAADIFSAEQELAAGHIALADWAELAVVAPATANLIARMRIGQGDDAAAAALLAIEPRRWLLAPAMNEKMWASPAVQENVRVLGERGARFIGPAVGEMAERSHVGPGRMSEPGEILAACSDALAPRDLEAVPVLVTAGPTREMLDPVRFLSNPSSGRMGWAIAEAARDRGARVTLISGPVELPRLANVQVVDVVSADELARAVDSHLDGVRVVVMAAAVADQRPAARAAHKAKKKPGEETLKLVRTPD